MALSEGQLLGPYRIEAPMGQGGMATIYRATQQRLGRVVAIKMLHPVFLQDTTFLARFEREAQIVARLDHPHIVPVYDFSDYNGQPYLVMKYIDGTTLKMAQADGPLPPAEILRLLTPIADALDYAHRQGVLHRDIKPSNILIAGDGTPWLTDFGLARMAALGSSTLSGDMMLGTPHYISPEQALGSQNLTAATDLYSFGVVLYALVTGRVPFTGDTPYAIVHAHIYDPLPAPRSINPNIAPAVEAVLVKALSKEPAQRYPTAAALIEAYRAALNANQPIEPVTRSEPAPEAEALLGGMDPFDSLAGTVTLPPDAAVASSFGSLPAAAPVEDVKPKRTVIETSFDLSDVSGSLRAAGESLRETFEGMSEGGSEADDDIAPPGDEAALRRRVERQLKKKSSLWKNALAYVVVIPIMWVVYGLSSGIFGPNPIDANLPLALMQFPWPAVVMLGWAAGLAGDAIETYHRTGARAAQRIARLHEAFRADYGPQWYRSAPRKDLKALRKRVDKPYKKNIDFQKNIASFAFIIPMLWIIYGFSSGFISAQIAGGDATVNAALGFPWPLIVMFIWGLNIINDGLSVRSAARTERAVEREMERQRSMAGAANWPDEKAKNDDHDDSTRIGEDGELTDSLAREIEREINQKRR